MADQNDDTLRAYLEQVMKIQREGHKALSQDDLDAVARDLGLDNEDMKAIRRHHDDCVDRAHGFLRYNNWGGAVDELKQAVTLAPMNANTHALLASAHRGRYGETRSDDDMNAALEAARRALAIEPRNELALRVASEMQRRSAPLSSSQIMRRAIVWLGLGALAFGVVYLIYTAASSKTAEEMPEGAAAIRARADSLARAMQEPVKPEAPVEPDAPVKPDTGFLQPLSVFSSEGIGEGMLKDARSIAVAGDSTIIVADYGDGRIQRFAPDGRFLNGWNVGEDRYIPAIAADRNGTVYVVASGTIERYEAATGKSLGQLKAPAGKGFAAVATAPGGKIATVWSYYAARSGMFMSPKANDAIIMFDDKGKVVSTWKNALGKANGGGAVFSANIAVDGLGTVYAGSRSFLCRFNNDGSFDDKIVLPSDNFVIDGQGRFIVAFGSSFFLHDRNGTLISKWELDRQDKKYEGVYNIDGLALSPSGDLFAVARTRILRLKLR